MVKFLVQKLNARSFVLFAFDSLSRFHQFPSVRRGFIFGRALLLACTARSSGRGPRFAILFPAKPQHARIYSRPQSETLRVFLAARCSAGN